MYIVYMCHLYLCKSASKHLIMWLHSSHLQLICLKENVYMPFSPWYLVMDIHHQANWILHNILNPDTILRGIRILHDTGILKFNKTELLIYFTVVSNPSPFDLKFMHWPTCTWEMILDKDITRNFRNNFWKGGTCSYKLGEDLVSC